MIKCCQFLKFFLKIVSSRHWSDFYLSISKNTIFHCKNITYCIGYVLCVLSTLHIPILQQVSPAGSNNPSPSRSFKAVNGSPGQLGGSRSQSGIQRPVSSIVSSQQSTPSGSRDPTRRQSIPSGAHPRPPQIIPENGPQPAMRSSEGPKMVHLMCYAYIMTMCCHVLLCVAMQSPEIRKYKRKFNGEILCGALWGVNLLVGTDNGLLLLDRSGHGKGNI